MKCVAWRERGTGGPASVVLTGSCVEVERDAESTYARTKCGEYVILPGPSVKGPPTCERCLAETRDPLLKDL